MRMPIPRRAVAGKAAGLVPVLLVLALGACSISQQVDPVSAGEAGPREICIVRNADVREGFLSALTQALEGRGIGVKVVESRADARDCPLTGTYVANWRWDMAMYMVYAKITVLRGTERVGEATYDASLGGGRLDKFIDADAKVQELVNQLFPD